MNYVKYKAFVAQKHCDVRVSRSYMDGNII